MGQKNIRGAEEYPEDDFRRVDPRYQGENDANIRATTIIHDIAAAKHATPGQIALAWLLQKGDDTVPIPGTKHRKYLEENGAAEALRLDSAVMNALDDAMAPGKVSGKRYADWIMATIDR
jgi:aryl-alcohol dehydrogenase-like predicted oxidoreductase